MLINYDINNKGGGASAEGCVRYDEAQDLTAKQQEQAKENLGIEEPEPQVYEVSSLDEIPAGTANQIYADYKDGKTVLVKESTLIGLVNYFSVVSAKSDNTYNYFTLSGKNCLYEVKSAKNPSYGELATLTTTTIPTVNNPTVTINQGGVTKGSFTLNQSGAATINLDAGGEAVQSDWNETDSDDPAYIKNKPTIPQQQAAVLYDQAQSLTDVQKKQVGLNIGDEYVSGYFGDYQYDTDILGAAARFENGSKVRWRDANDSYNTTNDSIGSQYDWLGNCRLLFAGLEDFTNEGKFEPVFKIVKQSRYEECGSVEKTFRIAPFITTISGGISEMDSDQFDEICSAVIAGLRVIVRTTPSGSSDITGVFLIAKYDKSGSGSAQVQTLYLANSESQTYKITKPYSGPLQIELLTTSANDPAITIKQGGVTKGSFTLNQQSAATINLDAGGEAVQSDWEETDTDDPAYIKNKPEIETYVVSVTDFNQISRQQFNQISEKFKSGVRVLILRSGNYYHEVVNYTNYGFNNETITCLGNQGLFVIGYNLATITVKRLNPIDDAPSSLKLYVRKSEEWVELPSIPQPENHQVLKDALSEPMGCQADTWATLAELTVPESGAYQVSASARMLPADQSTAYKTATVSIEAGTDAAGYTEVMEMTLPRSGEYGTMSVPVNATAGQKLRLRAISDANFYAQASPSAGKASATFIAAVRVGAIYQD